MNAASVNNLANYTLQDSLGNVYHLTSPNYASGTSATYQISNGPLQPGTYTFSVGSGIIDRTSNPLVPYTLTFTVGGVAPFTLAGRSDNSPLTATPLVTPTSQPDGTFVSQAYSVSASEPYFTASARLRGAGYPLDLVTANYNSGTISVMLGNGNGTFQSPVTYAVGSDPFSRRHR